MREVLAIGAAPVLRIQTCRSPFPERCRCEAHEAERRRLSAALSAAERRRRAHRERVLAAQWARVMGHIRAYRGSEAVRE